MKNLLSYLLGAVCIFFIYACANNEASSTPVELILKNGNVFLPDGSVETLDIVIDADTIVAIVKPKEDKWTAEKTIDVKGKFVMPGLIDAHAHFKGIGMSIVRIDLLGTHSWEEILDSVAHRVASSTPGEWIIGRGWHQEKWDVQPDNLVKGFPVNDKLNAISPDNPIILFHASGHGLIANEKAMELAGITASTPNPDGGVILKDKSGKPVGIFQENAMQLIRSVYDSVMESRPEGIEYKNWLHLVKLAEKECLSHGVTSVHDAGISIEEARRFHKLAQEGGLDVRLYSMLSESSLRNMNPDSILAFVHSTDSMKYFKMRSVKGYMDGALGSRGAWMLEPYSDAPEYYGENVTPVDTLLKAAKIAKELGMQMCIHAIGDRANREVLNIYEKLDVKGLRWRIEHAQHINPEDIPRFVEMGVIASMQPIHCTSDAPYVIDRLGYKRAENGAYIWKTLLENGVRLAFGTDAPVEKIDPFANIFAAVTRFSYGTDTTFFPEQALSRKKTLMIYTQGNAYAEFAEREKGKIKVGMLADIIVLNQNLLTCPVNDIPNTEVLYTIVGGNIKYEQWTLKNYNLGRNGN